MELSGKTNINPKIWGPYFWKTFHYSIYGYPKEPNDLDKKTYKLFYETFMKILPCNKCSIDSQKMLNEDLIKGLESRDELIKWGHNFHNAVNFKLGVAQPDLETIMKDVNKQLSGNSVNVNVNVNYYTHIFAYLLISIIILYMSYVFFKHRTYHSL
jgi:hypothetical protein